ncbi:MAG: putative DNA-binding domain-containing protein [Hyphomicrobiaceae bacterium]|nr:putative DNA-binding domain-containing protein [Hyphomicrobiaceae bacterium]
MPLEALQSAFARGLIDPDAPVPAGVVDPEGRPAPKRFAVYRNNVTVSLIEGLKAAYPAIVALIGDEPFTHIAREFIRAHPPTSPVMLRFGKGFAEYLETLSPLAHLPFLADVARLERAWMESYHAADAAVLDPAKLSGVAPEAFAAARFDIHPAARLVPSGFPILDLWEAGRAGTGQGIDPTLSQWALVTRPDVEVRVLAVSASSGPFVADLMAGKCLGDAAEARNDDPKFDLQRALSRILAAGLFTDIDWGK